MAWLWAQSIDSNVAWLTADEVHHVSRVLRRRVGAELEVIDGAGRRARGTWAGDARIDVRECEAWPRRSLTLILGLGARNANEDALKRAAELGAAEVVPVLTERSADAGAHKQRFDLDRWRRIAASACAQAGNPWLPDLHEPQTWAAVRDRFGADRITAVDPRAAQPLDAHAPAAVVAVGPEGGFTDAELDGCARAGLGPYVLRTPVAVAVALGCLATRWEPQCAA